MEPQWKDGNNYNQWILIAGTPSSPKSVRTSDKNRNDADYEQNASSKSQSNNTDNKIIKQPKFDNSEHHKMRIDSSEWITNNARKRTLIEMCSGDFDDNSENEELLTMITELMASSEVNENDNEDTIVSPPRKKQKLNTECTKYGHQDQVEVSNHQQESRNRVIKDLSTVKHYIERQHDSYSIVKEMTKIDLSRWEVLNSITECAMGNLGGDNNPLNIYYSGHGETNTGNWCFKDGTVSLRQVLDTIQVVNYFKPETTLVNSQIVSLRTYCSIFFKSILIPFP